MARDESILLISTPLVRTAADVAISDRKPAAILIPAAVACSILCALTTIATAAGPAAIICNREKLPGRSYIECLEAALLDSDRALTVASLRTQKRIEARADLAVTRRTRWKNVLEEAQGQFIRFRNFDCQNVAPYEGTSGRIGAFNERLVCLIEKNFARTQELLRRYGIE